MANHAKLATAYQSTTWALCFMEHFDKQRKLDNENLTYLEFGLMNHRWQHFGQFFLMMKISLSK